MASSDHEVDNITDLMNSISITTFCVGSAHWIEVTHINNPSSFYVRPTVYNSYLPSLEAPGSIIDPKEVYLGMTIIFKSKKLNTFIRGQIIFINEENMKLDLFALDYGHVERDILLKEICKPLNVNAVPSLVKHCELELCKPVGGTWNEESINAMKFYIGDERTKIIVQDKTEDLLTVKMYNSLPEDISTMLALTSYSTFGYDPRNSINRFSAAPTPKKNFYHFSHLKIGECLKVRTQSGKKLDDFYVADESSYKKYIEERENIAYFARKAVALRPEDLHEGLPVCVPTIRRYKYERGIIKRINQPDSALVQLVDWGDVIEVQIDRIKPIRESFLEREAVAIYCKAGETQMWDNRLLKFIYPGFTFMIEITLLGNQLLTPNIVKMWEV